MLKHFALVVCFFVCGCSFDLSVLRGHQQDSAIGGDASDAQQQIADTGVDSDSADAWLADVDAALDPDTGADAWVEDTGTDAAVDPDAWIPPVDGGTDSGPALTCTDVPSIAGSYRLNYRLMFCTSADYGYLPLTRTDACDYSFDDGTTATTHIFNGPCAVVIEGSTYSYECTIQYGAWTYGCTLTPVSGGLNADCRFVSGASPPSTAPCSFFMPSM